MGVVIAHSNLDQPRLSASPRATVSWQAADVQDAAERAGIAMAPAQVNALLIDMEGDIIDAMIEAGWSVIDRRLEHLKGLPVPSPSPSSPTL